MVTSIRSLVDDKRGLLDRNVFADKDIYQRELEQVFGRCWLFVAHESQIPHQNDFTANYIGEDPVLITRDSKGKLHTFLNMCRHRGNRICRADFGNAPSFMCTYHGWTFSTDGKLVGVPGYKEAYFEELDRSQWGLVEARTETYKGLVYANWDINAPSLADYLGDVAWYLDMLLDRREGGTEVVGGVHKWLMATNWKLPTDNIAGDNYHVPVTHGSMGMVRGARSGWSAAWQVSPGNGHGIVNFGGARVRKASDPLPTEPIARYNALQFEEMRKRLGEVRATAGTASPWNVFPNFSYNSTLRIMHPRGPTTTEEWVYLIVEKDAPQEIKDAIRKGQTYVHGVSGAMEADDQANFIQCTSSGMGLIGKRYPLNQQAGVGHEVYHEEFPGKTMVSPSENNQRSFYSWWADMMDAPSWNAIKLNPKTKR